MADNSTPAGERSKKVRGNLIPDKTQLGAHLRSGKIAAFTVVGVVAIAAGGFWAIGALHGFGGAAKPAPMHPHKAPEIAPQPKSAPSISTPKPSTPSAPAKSAVSKASAASAPAEVPPVNAPQNTQPSPQMLAFQQAIGQQGGSGEKVISWSGPSAGEPLSLQPTGMTASDALAQSLAMAKAASQKPSDAPVSVYSTHLVRKEVSPYELLQGTVIPGILTTGIKSDIPGQVTAVVPHPVYNSLNGAYVLIPAGSRLIGQYAASSAMGQTRVNVAWTRIEFPNGTYVQLSKMPGTAPDGYAGFHDLVNNHTWTIFKNALLLSLIDVGMAVASPTSTSTNTTGVTGNEALQDGEQALAQTFGQAEAQMLQKYVNIAPTLTIRPGYAFNVVVTKDLVFPGPYRHGANLVATSANPRSPAQPTIIDPYPEP
ncbi:conjugal transfer protein TrbI [Acidithiobacillus caldus]|uniref:TrbI/VirB10 family protein n=1 Tax=Acidithiobacillus caldus TaxID=33059 RepID=UPI001C07CFA7|nr:TrbI/VirB10 family protein [Acidithiobacillus caldus]MBU2783822.1 conjugal transfer protein TrbI [Acidithiobacillus caldus]